MTGSANCGARNPVIVTGPPDALLEEKALELGAEEYVDKPHTAKSLRRQVLRMNDAAWWIEHKNDAATTLAQDIEL